MQPLLNKKRLRHNKKPKPQSNTTINYRFMKLRLPCEYSVTKMHSRPIHKRVY